MKIYENVHILDFSSLYPNLIRQMRLSPENKYSDVYNNNSNLNLVIDKSEFKQESGLLDTYITELLELRKEYRNKGMEAEQLAVKIIANSVYGLLSQKTTKFVLGGTNIASTVTWAGRTILHTLVGMLPKYGITVVYGKTDSIFVISNTISDKDEILNIAQSCVDNIVKDITGLNNDYIKFDYEEFLTKFLIVNKNNYVKVYNNGSRKLKGASFYNSKSSRFDIDVINHILDNIIDGTVYYKNDVSKLAHNFLNVKINKEDMDYFAIKHKPRENTVNKWDNVQYMRENELDIEWGFYHNAVIAHGVKNPTGVLIYPLGHQPDPKQYHIDRKWVEANVDKILNKLALEDRNLQTSLDKFFR